MQSAFGQAQRQTMSKKPQGYNGTVDLATKQGAMPLQNPQASSFNQHFQNPQVQHSLFQIGSYLGSIGHPLAEAFNKFHNLGQQQQPQVAPRAPQTTQQQIMNQIADSRKNPLLRGSFGTGR